MRYLYYLFHFLHRIPSIEKILEEKKMIIQSSKEILTWYNELKNHCLNYTKTIKLKKTGVTVKRSKSECDRSESE